MRSRYQTGGNDRASPFEGSITPPLTGSRGSRADPWACRRAGDGGGGISTPYRMQAACSNIYASCVEGLL